MSCREGVLINEAVYLEVAIQSGVLQQAAYIAVTTIYLREKNGDTGEQGLQQVEKLR